MAKYLLYGSEENGLLLEAEPSIIHLETGEGITPVSVQNQYTLTCDKDTYSVTGYDAGLKKLSVLQTDVGNYVVTGKNTGLIKTSYLSANKGQYNVTGYDVNFSYVEAIVAPVEDDKVIRVGGVIEKKPDNISKRLLQEDEEILSIIYTFMKCQ